MPLMPTQARGQFINALGGSSALATTASLVSSPWAVPIMAGIGAFTSFLGARRQDKLAEEYKRLGSAEYLDSVYGKNLQRQAGQFSASYRSQLARESAAGDATAARFRRAGLSGVGESVAQGVRAGVSLNAQRARDSFRLEIFRNSQEQVQREQAAMLALMGTPYGNVSPTAAALGGAGTGIEAVQNARFAEQLFGSRG